MIKIEFTQSKKVLMLTLTGTLTVDGIAKIKMTLDEHINQDDNIPNLVLHLSKMPHWDGFQALKEHLKLVKDHQRLIKKIAIVGGGVAVTVVPYIMDHFIAAKLRHFPERRLEEAKTWAEAEDDHPGEFEILDGLPRDVVGIRARGIITAQDYEKTLIPLI
ncbi:MAG: STAS/SEC14 domain-containing protein, partial [Aestuariivirga sp.]